jgi:shikimate kinase
MSYFIIIRGPLGVGKSTIAKKLASELHGEYVDIDKILDENGLDEISEDEGCIPAENFIKADNLILPELKKKLQNKQPVIFDACFYHKEHVEHLIDNLPFPHYVFTLKAPVEVCIKRDSEREKTHGEGAAQAVHYLVSRFDYGTVIDTNGKTIDETFKEIFSFLPPGGGADQI